MVWLFSHQLLTHTIQMLLNRFIRSLRGKSLLLLASAAASLAATGSAQVQEPGSLLLYPEFDNRSGIVSLLTVTNTLMEEVEVEFVYIGKFGSQNERLDCGEFNRPATLTPGDTFTVVTNDHNPNMTQGYVYVFARSAVNVPTLHNGLIGSTLIVSGLDAFEYSINPLAYEGLADNDVNGNGLRDLDGVEYSANADEILIPRFFGQGGMIMSDLILIGLTGGAQFNTTVDFLVYNDNEEVFSTEHSFRCWDKVSLMDISALFGNDFLRNHTNDDAEEVFGAPQLTAGWMRLRGAVANTTSATFASPAIFAALVERIANRGAADLPFGTGTNLKGELLASNGAGDA